MTAEQTKASKRWKKLLRVLQWSVWYAARILRAFIPNAEQKTFRKWNSFVRDACLLAWVAACMILSVHFVWIGIIVLSIRFVLLSHSDKNTIV